MSNDALRHQMTEVLALVQEQMADIAAVQREQAQLTASSKAADGLVEVTVDARGHVVETVIDETYLDEYELEELGGHVTEAAQSAAQLVAQRSAALMMPIEERRRMMPSLSDVVDSAPDLRDLTRAVYGNDDAVRAGEPEDDDRDESAFPTVRR
ncbi:YbaB/EbfC family nucleoid-associated protein [Mycolicibacterium septicum DSM 44393]|uniref:YbaB/EbfC family nucleoid-associated protein n=1 Tax=Mycolicibacterium septicum DSM 44393 TaxID=1341646 RepID=A0A7X6MN39_9MYCO|nr:YbaB/EbfC family nucleoid-associated protein [Mycolicibacterium septicum]NKZ11820.1 YbaB/EbfC family nucleoid-associated protein [Mycolicibacterium septicum DSM 44393]